MARVTYRCTNLTANIGIKVAKSGMLIHLLASKWIQLLDPLLALTGRSGVERRRLTVPAVCRNATDLPFFVKAASSSWWGAKKQKTKESLKRKKVKLVLTLKAETRLVIGKSTDGLFFDKFLIFSPNPDRVGLHFFFFCSAAKKTQFLQIWNL